MKVLGWSKPQRPISFHHPDFSAWDPLVGPYILDNPPPSPLQDMPFCSPATADVIEATKLYDVPQLPINLPESILADAVTGLVEDIKSFGYVYTHTPVADVSIVPDASSGAGYRMFADKGSASAMAINRANHCLRLLLSNQPCPPPIWISMEKRENQPARKINAHSGPYGDLRSLIYSPIDHQLLGGTVTSSLDLALKRGIHPWVYYGKSLQRGTFHTIALKLLAHTHKFKGDVRKYDRSVSRHLMHLVYNVRRALSPDFVHPILDYLEHSLNFSIVQLPDGTIVEMPGQKSGSKTTTTDNCIAHLIILYSMVLVYHRDNGLSLSLDEIIEKIFVALYSDDHIGSSSIQELVSTSYRTQHYKKFHMDLKTDDDYVSTTLDHNFSFLGGSFQMYTTDYVPQYDMPKIVGSMFKPSKPLSRQALISTLQSLQILTVPDTAWFDYIYVWLRTLTPRVLTRTQVFRKFYSRSESTVDVPF